VVQWRRSSRQAENNDSIRVPLKFRVLKIGAATHHCYNEGIEQDWAAMTPIGPRETR